MAKSIHLILPGVPHHYTIVRSEAPQRSLSSRVATLPRIPPVLVTLHRSERGAERTRRSGGRVLRRSPPAALFRSDTTATPHPSRRQTFSATVPPPPAVPPCDRHRHAGWLTPSSRRFVPSCRLRLARRHVNTADGGQSRGRPVRRVGRQAAARLTRSSFGRYRCGSSGEAAAHHAELQLQLGR